MNKKLKFLIVFFLFACTNGFGEGVERRAAFLFDSDNIELRVADVDLKENKIIQQVFSEIENISFNEDLWSDPRKSLLSKKTQDVALSIVKKMMKKAESFNVQAKRGFAGESFRKAKNAQDLVKRIYDETDLNVLILSEEQEGIVEFIAAVNMMQVNPVKTITWNIGLDFMRLTAQCQENYSVYVKNVWRDLFRHVTHISEKGEEKKKTENFHVNPLSEEDLKKEVDFVKNAIKDIPSCIREKAANPNNTVLEFGNRFSRLKSNIKEYTLEEVQEALQQRIGKWQAIAYNQDTRTFPAASFNNIYGMALADLIMIYGVMDALGIQRLKIMNDEPNTILGLLPYSPFWTR